MLFDDLAAGHSMGGQLVHRYSVLSSPILPGARRDLTVEYVVMNAASYLYFSGERVGPPALVSASSLAQARE